MGNMKVQYVGGSDFRHISAKHLEDLGITVSAEPVPKVVKAALSDHGIKAETDDLVWHPWNGWALNMDVSEGLERVLRAEGTFTLVKIKDDGSEEVEAVALDPSAEEEADVVDQTTGAKSAGRRPRS
jgi:hypothetical protein